MSSAELTSANSATKSTFAELLRFFRTAAELTQEELAERSGVSVRAISDLERGAKTRPQRATVELLASGLGLSELDRHKLEAAVPSRHRSAQHVTNSFDLPVGGFLGSVPEGPLVARNSEIEHLRAIVKTVVGGGGRLLLLSGEPGIGKTRLAQEATLVGRASGMQLATGQCYEAQQTVAFYPFLEILRRLIPTTRAQLRIEPSERWPQLLPLLLANSKQATARAISSGGDPDQQQLFWAVTELIEALAVVAPLVIALDDLHWSDQSSLDLIHHLTRHLRHVPVLFIGTFRDTEVAPGHPLRTLLLDLHREQLSEQIALRRLGQDGTGALMASALHTQQISTDFVDLVHRRTEGNAFFALEVVRMLVERGDAIEMDGVWICRATGDIDIPHTIHDAISERLSRLSAITQDILTDASVLGNSFGFDDLLCMSDRSESEVEAAVEEAVRAVVIRFGQGDDFAFNHALIQQVLYRGLSPRRRKRRHLAAGKAIEEQPRPVRTRRAAELAWHFQQAGELGRALPFSVMAADQAESRFAHRDAVRLYRQALELRSEGMNVGLRAEILEKLGRALTNFGNYKEARHELQRAGRLYREAVNQEGEVRTTVQLGSVYRAMGDASEGIPLVRDLLERLETVGRPQEVAELNIVLETLCYATGQYEEALHASERAAALARSTGDTAALVRAETGRGTELIVLGRLREGVEAMEGALANPVADDDPYNLVRLLENAADGYRSLGNFERSRELVERSLQIARHIQSPWDTAMALRSTGVTYRLLGEWDRSRADLEDSDQLSHSLPPTWWATYGIIELAALCLDDGNWERAAQLANEAAAIARNVGHIEGLRSAERLLAELDLTQGRPERAASRLERLLDRPGLVELQVTELMPVLAGAYAANGDPERARQTVEEAIRRSRTAEALLPLAEALVVRGRIYTAERCWDEAENDFEEAARTARGMPNPHLEGRALYERGLMRQQRGHIEQARENLNAALDIFNRLGARPYIERTSDALSASRD